MKKTDKPKRKYNKSGKYAKKARQSQAQTASINEKSGTEPAPPEVHYIPGSNVIDKHPNVQSTHVPKHHRIKPFRPIHVWPK